MEGLSRGGGSEIGESPWHKNATSQLLSSLPGAKESKALWHGTPGHIQAAPGQAADLMLALCPGLWQEHGCPLKIPHECQQGCAQVGGTPGAVARTAHWPPARTLSHPRTVAQLTARTALRRHVCTASHATHMALRAPSSTEDGSLPRTLPRHLHPATARQPCAPRLEQAGLPCLSHKPSRYPFSLSSKHHILSRSPPPRLPPAQGLFLPSPWKLQQRQPVTARSSRSHVHLSRLGLTHASDTITNVVAALACQEAQLGLCHFLHTGFPIQ